jgi:hypothetical protein
MYSVSRYLPMIEPVTPSAITAQMLSPNMICSDTITVNAGGRGKGSMSTPILPIKTSR